jgi:hypothetical protein
LAYLVLAVLVGELEVIILGPGKVRRGSRLGTKLPVAEGGLRATCAGDGRQ